MKQSKPTVETIILTKVTIDKNETQIWQYEATDQDLTFTTISAGFANWGRKIETNITLST